ncbi:hypothetical protein BDZ97DRAFT_1754196 [Flammula alnicola]|nr:hypothetical protein BDZ97DRAFT_1754196 [Flammula alnicola]
MSIPKVLTAVNALIDAVATGVAGHLIRKIETQKDPTLNIDVDDCTLAVMKVSEGEVDVGIIRPIKDIFELFESQDATVILSPPDNLLFKATLEKQSKATVLLKAENADLTDEKNKIVAEKRTFERTMEELLKVNDKIEEMKKDLQSEYMTEFEELKTQIKNIHLENAAIKATADARESTLDGLQDTVYSLRKTVDAINRRSLLNAAREKAYDALRNLSPPENPYAYTETELINKLHSILNTNSRPLSKEAIRLFCLSSRIRDEGNVAAHETTEAAAAHSVLAISEAAKRRKMFQVYRLVYGRESSL